MKNWQQLDYKIPASSSIYLRIYLERFRLLLCCGQGRALFPSHDGQSKRSDTLAKQIKRELQEELGLAWHPHLFRLFAAKIYLERYPGDYEGVRRLLAHRSAETTFQSYEGMEMRPAVDRYDRLIEEVRNSNTGPAPAHRRLAA